MTIEQQIEILQTQGFLTPADKTMPNGSRRPLAELLEIGNAAAAEPRKRQQLALAETKIAALNAEFYEINLTAEKYRAEIADFKTKIEAFWSQPEMSKSRALKLQVDDLKLEIESLKLDIETKKNETATISRKTTLLEGLACAKGVELKK